MTTPHVAGGRLHARVTPFGPASERRHTLVVQTVGDRLQRHALRTHLDDAFAEMRIVDHPWTSEGVTVAPSGPKPFSRSFAQPLRLPAGDLDQQVGREMALDLVGVEPVGRRDEAGVRAVQPFDDPAQLGG